MILDHGYHGVGDASLLGRETGVEILAEFLAQFPQDDGAISDLLAVQFNERQLALLGAEFHLVIHILKPNQINRQSLNLFKYRKLMFNYD